MFTIRGAAASAGLLLAVGLVGCGGSVPTNTANTEVTLKALQGEWNVVHLDRAGKVSTDRALKDIDVIIQKNAYQMWESKSKGPEGSPSGVKDLNMEEYIIQLDPAGVAGEIDLAYPHGDNQGKTRRGIYSLDGNDLKICMSAAGGSRPTSFAATANPAVTLIQLRRKPSA